MRVRITRTVPGYVNGETANVGEVVDLPDGLGLSLVTDGYASAVASAPAVGRSTASTGGAPEKRAPGRPRKET